MYYGWSGYVLAHISVTTLAKDFKFAGACNSSKVVVSNGGLNRKIGCQRNTVGLVMEGHNW